MTRGSWWVVALAVAMLPARSGADAGHPHPAPRPHVPPRGGGGAGGPCTDPLTGVWTGHRYDFTRHVWEVMTLTILRDPAGADALTGRIDSHIWSGALSDTTPTCVDLAGHDFEWAQTARGAVAGQRVTFEGTSVRTRARHCGIGDTYALDHFDGVLDGESPVIYALNNDGAYEFDAAYEFHRVRCE